LTKTPFLIIGVAAVSFTVAFVVLYAFVLQPLMLPNEDQFPTPTPFTTLTPQPTRANPTLTPARDLVGTWQTSYPATFYVKTDFSSPQLEDVGSENRTMTWVITSTNNENIVNVEITFAVTSRNLIDDSGYTPDVSPMFAQGTISGSTLTLQTSGDGTIGQFEFTSDIIHGTWNDSWTAAYSQQVYTATNGLTLARQW
jgi:hypothetical protein